MRKIEQIAISSADRERLERLVRDRNTPQKVVWRARIVLLASDGLTAEAIAAAAGKSLLTVRRWRRRYMATGVDGLLKDATRPSRVKPLSPEKIKQVVHMTLHEKPPNATHWSGRSMAAAAGISYSSIQRIWRAHGLKPHLVKTFNVPRHRHREFLCFLKLIDQKTPASLDLHLIADNYATHKTPAVKRWLKAHPRFHLHFTPTSASWLNMVERFFAEITRNRIRRGAFKSVAELKSAIMEYLKNHNAGPKPFVWTKSAGQILEKVAKAKQALESQH